MASLSDSLVQQFLNGRYIGAVASKNADGSIHVVSVWYLFADGSIYVATSTRTRKAKNISSHSQASIMIDSRDPDASCGITVTGTATLLTGEPSKKWNEKIHAKYLSQAALNDPKVGPVFAGWDDVTIQITPASVIAWDMREADRQVFGSSFANHPGYLLSLER